MDQNSALKGRKIHKLILYTSKIRSAVSTSIYAILRLPVHTLKSTPYVHNSESVPKMELIGYHF